MKKQVRSLVKPLVLTVLLPFAAFGAGSDRVVEIFTELSRVPRSSEHETKIGDWLMCWADAQGFNPTRDAAGCGNVIFDVPATEGMENKNLLVLQVHQDMVRATKEGVEHDWDVDPVIVDKTEGWLHSRDHETSLGADDGIGLATVLAIAEGGMAHGPLRVIATVEEESSQVGVKGIDPKWVKDAKGLINIDWEEEGEVAISSAAQETCTFTRSVATNAVTGKVLREIAVTGLRGGHSGIDIDKKRDNAIIDLAKTLAAIGKQTEYDLVSFKGGSAKNANPDSRLAALAGEVYRSAFGKGIAVVATHAGLECGAFSAKNPALDMISVGPTVQNPHTIDERCEVASIDRVWVLLEGLLLKGADPVVPVPVIASFAPDFTQGPTTEVPNVSWKIEGPFDRVALTIDDTTVYDGDTRCGDGRWRDVCSPGIHRLQLTVRHGDDEVSASCLYTALCEGDEPAVLPQIGYFYPDFYRGVEEDAPVVHWRADNITSVEIWVDAKCVLVTQDAVSEFRFSQLRNAGTHIVRIIAHNVTDDVESSFAYRTESRNESEALSAQLLQAAASAPVINAFYPDAYRASIRATPYIHWHLGGEVESLQLKIDDTPVFIGGGNAASGRWLDVSGLNIDALNGSHEVTLLVSNNFGVVTSNFTCTCYWEEPPPPPKGSEANPWLIGENVQAYTNGFGTLVIIGEGATSNFASAADLPWAEVVGEIMSVAIPDAVAVIGDNLWAGLGEDVVLNGETVARRKEIATGFPAEVPAGAISPGEFERVDIIGGKAYLDVSVYTSDTLTNQNWSVATNDVIEVPAPGRQGFFYLMSKPAGN